MWRVTLAYGISAGPSNVGRGEGLYVVTRAQLLLTATASPSPTGTVVATSEDRREQVVHLADAVHVGVDARLRRCARGGWRCRRSPCRPAATARARAGRTPGSVALSASMNATS